MQTIALLRKAMPSGYVSTYRFSEVDGRFIAKSNSGKVRTYPDRNSLNYAIKGFTQLGYTERELSPIVRKDVQCELIWTDNHPPT